MWECLQIRKNFKNLTICFDPDAKSCIFQFLMPVTICRVPLYIHCKWKYTCVNDQLKYNIAGIGLDFLYYFRLLMIFCVMGFGVSYS